MVHLIEIHWCLSVVKSSPGQRKWCGWTTPPEGKPRGCRGVAPAGITAGVSGAAVVHQEQSYVSYVVYVHKNEDSHIVYPPLSTKILMVIHGLYMVYTVLLVDEVSVLVDSANLSNHSFWGWSLQKPSWPMGILETRASTAFVFGVSSGPCETVMV